MSPPLSRPQCPFLPELEAALRANEAVAEARRHSPVNRTLSQEQRTTSLSGVPAGTTAEVYNWANEELSKAIASSRSAEERVQQLANLKRELKNAAELRRKAIQRAAHLAAEAKRKEEAQRQADEERRKSELLAAETDRVHQEELLRQQMEEQERLATLHAEQEAETAASIKAARSAAFSRLVLKLIFTIPITLVLLFFCTFRVWYAGSMMGKWPLPPVSDPWNLAYIEACQKLRLRDAILQEYHELAEDSYFRKQIEDARKKRQQREEDIARKKREEEEAIARKTRHQRDEEIRRIVSATEQQSLKPSLPSEAPAKPSAPPPDLECPKVISVPQIPVSSPEPEKAITKTPSANPSTVQTSVVERKVSNTESIETSSTDRPKSAPPGTPPSDLSVFKALAVFSGYARSGSESWPLKAYLFPGTSHEKGSRHFLVFTTTDGSYRRVRFNGEQHSAENRCAIIHWDDEELGNNTQVNPVHPRSVLGFLNRDFHPNTPAVLILFGRQFIGEFRVGEIVYELKLDFDHQQIEDDPTTGDFSLASVQNLETAATTLGDAWSVTEVMKYYMRTENGAMKRKYALLGTSIGIPLCMAELGRMYAEGQFVPVN